MTEIKNQTLQLKTGYDMPVLGLGTWELTGKTCEQIVPKAVEMGYRHIDTAELYENESQIGKALQGLDRQALFITSKVASKHLARKDVLRACEQSLRKLHTDYLDLYLVHWPNDSIPVEETLEAMQQLVEKQMIRSVGLSNFDKDRLRHVLSISPVPLCNLQIEYHPFTPREALPEFCRQQQITITAYSPLARGKVLHDPTLQKIAEQYGRSPAQVSLKWLLQKGNIVIPKASSEGHLRDNMQMDGWNLTPEQIETIDHLGKPQRLVDTKYT